MQMNPTPFACGGSFEVVEFADEEAPSSNADGSDSETPIPYDSVGPVQIRFGPDGAGRTLNLLPSPNNTSALQGLLASCTPATFGRGKQDVLDESYRKVTKLDPSEFATTFCPYEAGIIDVVAQFLLPKSTNVQTCGAWRHGGAVQAERLFWTEREVQSPCGHAKKLEAIWQSSCVSADPLPR